MKLIIMLLVAFLIIDSSAYAVTAESILADIDQIKGVIIEKGDRFHILVSSITTSDKDLFPAVGQIILHTKGSDNNFAIKSLIIKSPDEVQKYIAISLKKVNEGNEMDVLFATKFGKTLSILKMKLLDKSAKVSSTTGGLIKIRILRNGIFKSYRKYKMQLSRFKSEWIGKIKIGNNFIPFQSMHIKASKFGVKKVIFQ